MKIGICTFAKYHGRKGIGSSRIRGEWLTNHWEEAEIYKQGGKYDVLIFQKVYWTALAKAFKGVKIFDLCDPDFLHWAYRTVEMLENVDIVTTSTPVLAKQLVNLQTNPLYVYLTG